MIYISRNASYVVVSTILDNEVNCCYTAKPEGARDGREYALLVIKDHETVRSLMEVVSSKPAQEGSVLVESFSYGQEYVLVFPYRQERPIDRFYVGEAYSLERMENICISLILSCISAGLPYPLLYLILTQGQVNIAKDDSIFLSFAVDLSDFDSKKTERDCAVKCADIMLKILEEKADQKNISYELLSKKSANMSYTRFTELYRDISIAATPVRKRNIIVRIKSFFYRNADTLFGILFWICLILGIVALVMLLTHLVWGDIPFLRIFFNSFKKIGTESLQQ